MVKKRRTDSLKYTKMLSVSLPDQDSVIEETSPSRSINATTLIDHIKVLRFKFIR